MMLSMRMILMYLIAVAATTLVLGLAAPVPAPTRRVRPALVTPCTLERIPADLFTAPRVPPELEPAPEWL